MKLNLMATAFIRRNGHYLMLKRAATRSLAPGMWAGVGGHIEPEEIADPDAACLREIREETGFTRKDLLDFRLVCLVLRQYRDQEIRQQFIYFADTERETFVNSEEGELYWIPEAELMSRPMMKTTEHVLFAFLAGRFEPGKLYLGVLDAAEDGPVTSWIEFADFERPIK